MRDGDDLGLLALLAAVIGVWLLLLLSGCAFSVRSDSVEAQMQSLSHLFDATGVQTCTKLTIIIPPYAQATMILNGRSTWEECLKALYPY